MEDTVFSYFAKEFFVKALRQYHIDSAGDLKTATNQLATSVASGFSFLYEKLTSKKIEIPLGYNQKITAAKGEYAEKVISQIIQIKPTDDDSIYQTLKDKIAEAVKGNKEIKVEEKGRFAKNLERIGEFLDDFYSILTKAKLLNIPFVPFNGIEALKNKVDNKLTQETNPIRMFEYIIANYFYVKLVANHNPTWSETFTFLFQGLKEEKKEAAINLLSQCRAITGKVALSTLEDQLTVIKTVQDYVRLLYLENTNLCGQYSVQANSAIPFNLIKFLSIQLPELKPSGGILEENLSSLTDYLDNLRKQVEQEISKKEAEEIARKEVEEIAKKQEEALLKQQEEESKLFYNQTQFDNAFEAFSEQIALYEKTETKDLALLEKTMALLVAFKAQLAAMPISDKPAPEEITIEAIIAMEETLASQIKTEISKKFTEKTTKQQVTSAFKHFATLLAKPTAVKRPIEEEPSLPDNGKADDTSVLAKQSAPIAPVVSQELASSAPNQEPASSSVPPKPHTEPPLPSVGTNANALHAQGGAAKQTGKNSKVKTTAPKSG